MVSASHVAPSTALVQANVTASPSGSVAVAVYSNVAPTFAVCAGMAFTVGAEAAETVTVMATGELAPSLSVAVNEKTFAPIWATVGTNRKSPVPASKSHVAAFTALVQA